MIQLEEKGLNDSGYAHEVDMVDLIFKKDKNCQALCC